MPRAVCGALLFVSIAMVAAQAAVHIRLATLAPENSPWHTALADMGAAWTRATSGRVVLTIFPGSSIDSESSAIAKMSPALDKLQAATLTTTGLGQIDDAFNVFGVPFLFSSDAELEAVQTALAPMLAIRLEAHGYHLVNWSNAGWIRLFSKTPIRTWEDAKRALLYTADGDPRSVEWYTHNGFHAVPLKSQDIPGELKRQNGRINATPSPAYFALALQFYRDAPNMLDLRLAPLVSATVVVDRVWRTIGADDRVKLSEIAASAGKKIESQAPTLEADAIREMRESTKGAPSPFQVITLDDASASKFRAEADRLIASQRGTLVPADVFDAALRARAALRQTN